MWQLNSRTRTPTTPYPATKEIMEANRQAVKDRAVQVVKDRVARKRKAKEEKDKKERDKAANRAFKNK